MTTTKTLTTSIGHGAIQKLFRDLTARHTLHHAYLVWGPPQVGKGMLAHWFAQLLFCEESRREPCGQCAACQQVQSHTHPDLLWIQRGHDERSGNPKKNITIEQVRQATERLSQTSFLGGPSVAVIDGAEHLSLEAANALLKTLEEPAPHTFLILLCHDPASLPATVLSRCQQVRCSLVDAKTIHRALVDRGASHDQATELTALSLGRPGRALALLADPQLVAAERATVDEYLGLIGAPLPERFAYAATLASAGGEDLLSRVAAVQQTLDSWATVTRDLLVLHLQSDGEQQLVYHWLRSSPKIATLQKYSVATLLRWLTTIEQTRTLLNANANPQLALERLVLTFE